MRSLVGVSTREIRFNLREISRLGTISIRIGLTTQTLLEISAMICL